MRILITSTIVLLITLAGCKKYLDIDKPKDQIVSSVVFTSDNTATSAISSIYNNMMLAEQVFNVFTTTYTGAEGDEFTTDLPDALEFFNNQISVDNSAINNFWVNIYKSIYIANANIEGLQISKGVTPALQSQLTGEAKFLRAFCYFYLVNLWGEVPLVTTTNYNSNAILARSSIDKIYDQIIEDLEDAKNRLTPEYPSSEKARANKFTAIALLARVYLYRDDWANAEIQSSEVIGSGLYSPLPSLDDAFLKNNKEAIWQLKPVYPDYNTFEARYFIPYDPFSNPGYRLTDDLYNSIDLADERKTKWIGTINLSGTDYHFPFKYKVRVDPTVTEYYTVLRLAEQYLIRAEARARLDKITGPNSAEEDLNIIRSRAGLPGATASTQEEMLAAIEQERRVELFAEWGHRWFDVNRLGKSNAVFAPLKGSAWQATDILWPIPQSQRNVNPNLSQNEGY